MSYVSGTTLYDHPPVGSESLEILENAAKERLKLYEILRKQKLRNAKSYKLEKRLKNSCLLYLLRPQRAENYEVDMANSKRVDFHSHWLLRIAYSRTPEMRRLFVELEVEWFHQRYKRLSPLEKVVFESNCGIMPSRADPRETRKIIQEKPHLKNYLKTMVYKIHFTESPTMMLKKKCVSHNGYLYFPEYQIEYMTLDRFKYVLETDLEYCSKIPLDVLDPRLVELIGTLELLKPSQFCKQPTKPDLLMHMDEEASVNYPLCVRLMQQRLTLSNHLKFFGRLQYSSFLKELGLNLEDVLKYFRDKFTKNMTEERFEARYAYLFRDVFETYHEPMDCQAIINQPVRPNSGCPFKNLPPQELRRTLERQKIPENAIDSIVDNASSGHYNVACSEYFNAVNGIPRMPIVVQHPNQYYAESCRVKCKCCELADIEDLFKE